MELKEEFKALLATLDPSRPIGDNKATLKAITSVWDAFDDDNIRVTELLPGNIIFLTLAQVMEKKYMEWVDNFPDWISMLLHASRVERDFEHEFFPEEHMRVLYAIFRKYLLSDAECVSGYRYLMLFSYPKLLLLQDDGVYNIVKSKLKLHQLLFLQALTGNGQWLQKLLNDHDLILRLLAVPEGSVTNQKWDVFFYLAHHPDAKTLLPKAVVLKVCQSHYARQLELCALLCSEDDLKLVQLDANAVDAMGRILGDLITKGIANDSSLYYSLASIILPISNMSMVESKKEMIGHLLIPQLVHVITGDLPSTMYTTKYIPRARQEASKALWHLAYVESNRAVISKGNGVNKLSNKLASTDDTSLKKNIEGILYMLTNHPGTVQQKYTKRAAMESEAKWRVMISHSWANQHIVNRIAQELRARGYSVWIDTEQISGSTLEATVEAIAQSEIVLICMSQKYKDSPSSRLESEYCVCRKISYIPLMMQKGYRPDGWLGTILGSRLYYEFCDEESWEFKIEGLVKAIVDTIKSPVATAPFLAHD